MWRSLRRALTGCALALVVVGARPLGAQPTPVAEGFTLADALAAARAHPRLAAPQSLVRATGFDAAAAGRWTNPQLGVSYMRSFGFTTFDPQVGVAQVGVTQMIETAGAPSRRRRAAEGERTAARFELEHTRRAIELAVRVGCVRLATAWARRAILRDALARTDALVALVGQRVAAGAAPGYERTRAALALADARAALADAEADVTAARGALDVAVGPAASSLRGAPQIELMTLDAPPPLARLLAALPATRADLGALGARAQAARARVDVARAEAMPGFALYAGVLVGQGYGEQGQRQVDGMVGVTLPLPVVNSGEDAVRAAEARAQAARELVAVETAEARVRLEAAWREAAQRREALEDFRSGAAEQDRLVAESTLAYRDGRIPIQALLDAHDAVRDARLRAVDLARAARESEASMWSLVGERPADAAP